MPRTPLLVALVTALVTALLPGCGGDPCAELADICARCPSDALGAAARDSCERAVASGDEAACADRIDERTYEALGACVER